MNPDAFTFVDVGDMLGSVIVEWVGTDTDRAAWLLGLAPAALQALMADCIRPLFDKAHKPPGYEPAVAIYAVFHRRLTERAGGTYIYGTRDVRKAVTEARIATALAVRPALSMREVAARAGVARSTLYSYLERRTRR